MLWDSGSYFNLLFSLFFSDIMVTPTWGRGTTFSKIFKKQVPFFPPLYFPPEHILVPGNHLVNVNEWRVGDPTIRSIQMMKLKCQENTEVHFHQPASGDTVVRGRAELLITARTGWESKLFTWFILICGKGLPTPSEEECKSWQAFFDTTQWQRGTGILKLSGESGNPGFSYSFHHEESYQLAGMTVLDSSMAFSDTIWQLCWETSL